MWVQGAGSLEDPGARQPHFVQARARRTDEGLLVIRL